MFGLVAQKKTLLHVHELEMFLVVVVQFHYFYPVRHLTFPNIYEEL
jgi:hypothetical protein